MVSDDSGYNERRPLRYTTLDFTEEEWEHVEAPVALPLYK